MYPKSIFVCFAAILLATVFANCKKSNPTGPSSSLSHTSGMGGVRNWHRSHYYYAYGVHYPTPIYQSYMLSDTAFAVVIVDDSTINFKGTTFKYEQTDSINNVYFFGMAYYFYKYGSGQGIAYFYKRDSIVHCHGDKHGTSDTWELRDLYYTY